MRLSLPTVLLALTAPAPAADPVFVFRDVATEAGLFPALDGARGHGAAWGDADGDGRPDLYVGTFATGGGPTNRLFRNAANGTFTLDPAENLRIASRATGIVFADLDNDGDADLYVGSMPAGPGTALAKKEGRPLRGCALFRNDGGGKFTDVSEGNGACPPAFGGRGVTVLDFDGDGLLDVLVGEEPGIGYNGSTTASSRLFRNLGGLRFEDATAASGITANTPALGVAAGDVNNDGRPDVFLACNRGNVLFLNDGGRFREAPGGRETFLWKGAKGDDMVAGVALADVNADGLLDVVVGPHFDHPWRDPVPVRLYLNRGVADGVPKFEEITGKAGLAPLGMKAPHVEVQDFDNDGRVDIAVSIVKFANGKPHPVVFRGLGSEGGVPRFRDDAWAVNPFPTAEDRAVGRSAKLFEKVLAERTVFYAAPGPAADYDGDGRLDLFLPSWWPEAKALLLRNETPGGNWLRVRVDAPAGVNRTGVGARVRVYPPGKLGDAAARLGEREIAVGSGYASGQLAEAHFGLGPVDSVDVEVVLPHGKGTLTRAGVKANQVVTVGK